MVVNATFHNISVILWRSVLLVETGGPEKTSDMSQVTDKLYHIMLYTSPWSRFELTTSVVIGTDCICSYKSNYHTTTATTAHPSLWMLNAMHFKQKGFFQTGEPWLGENHRPTVTNFIKWYRVHLASDGNINRTLNFSWWLISTVCYLLIPLSPIRSWTWRLLI